MPHVFLGIPEQIKLVVVEPELVVHDRIQVRQGYKGYQWPIWNHLLRVVNPQGCRDVIVKLDSDLVEPRLSV